MKPEHETPNPHRRAALHYDTAEQPMEPAVEHLLASPALPKHIERLNQAFEEEQRARRDFYEWLTPERKAEFINGEVVVHSPARKRHINVTGNLHTLLQTYVRIYDLGFVAQEKALITLTRNDYEPDVCFFGREKTRALEEDQLYFPAPDFIAEVLSPSTAENDRGIKMEDYAAHGVAEYWLLDPEKRVLEQYLLEGERYALQMKSATGDVRSAAVEGFEIPVRALFDDAENLRVLKALLQG